MAVDSAPSRSGPTATKKATCSRAPARDRDRAADPVLRAVDLDVSLRVGENRERRETRQRRTLEQHGARWGARHANRVLERPRCLHAKLPVPCRALESDVDRPRRGAPILYGKRVHRARHIGVAAIRCEDRPAHQQVADRAGERRNPAERALPRDRNFREIVAYAIHAEHRASKRRLVAAHEIRTAGKLDRRTRRAMQHPDGMDRRVRGMNARQRDPMIAGDLPGNGRRREQ